MMITLSKFIFTIHNIFYFILVLIVYFNFSLLCRAFQTTIKERLSEGGASGAFFFFSKGEIFIAKSCSVEEVENLIEAAQNYANYLVENPKSFISKVSFRIYIFRYNLLII